MFRFYRDHLMLLVATIMLFVSACHTGKDTVSEMTRAHDEYDGSLATIGVITSEFEKLEIEKIDGKDVSLGETEILEIAKDNHTITIKYMWNTTRGTSDAEQATKFAETTLLSALVSIVSLGHWAGIYETDAPRFLDKTCYGELKFFADEGKNYDVYAIHIAKPESVVLRLRYIGEEGSVMIAETPCKE